MRLILIIPQTKDLLGPCGLLITNNEALVSHARDVIVRETGELDGSVCKLSEYTFDNEKLHKFIKRTFKKRTELIITKALDPFSAEDAVVENLTYLTRDQFEFSKGVYRPVLGYSSSIQVAKIIIFLIKNCHAKNWNYTKRKKNGLLYKDYFSSSEKAFFLLPKETTATCASGTFKIGRKAICLQKLDKKWISEEVWHLKGKKGVESSFITSRLYENELEGIVKRELISPKLLVDFDKAKKLTNNRHAFFELCQRTLFADLIENKFDTIEKKKTVLVEIASLVKQLHCKGVVHRDIKPENIVRDSSGKWKLCDLDSLLTEKRKKRRIL